MVFGNSTIRPLVRSLAADEFIHWLVCVGGTSFRQRDRETETEREREKRTTLAIHILDKRQGWFCHGLRNNGLVLPKNEQRNATTTTTTAVAVRADNKRSSNVSTKLSVSTGKLSLVWRCFLF